MPSEKISSFPPTSFPDPTDLIPIVDMILLQNKVIAFQDLVDSVFAYYGITPSQLVSSASSFPTSNKILKTISSGRSITPSGINIDAVNTITGIKSLFAEKFQFTVNEAVTPGFGNGFYYTDNIQNGFTGSSAITGTDLSNLFSGVYWQSNVNYTKALFGLSGNFIFNWHQRASTINGAQAVLGSLLNTGGGTFQNSSGVRSILVNAGSMVDCSFFSGQLTNAFGTGTYNGLYAYHQPVGSVSGATGTNKYCVRMEDTSPNYFAGKVGIGGAAADNPQETLQVAGTVRFDIGSDATNDMYYRNASGQFTRIPIGSEGDTLKIVGGIPTWTV